ncbi:MAG: hypothetical protein AB9895_00050 [Negativicutes bacterium]
MLELEHTREILGEMGLNIAAKLLDARLEEAVQGKMTYLSFLFGLLDVEKQDRKRRNEETRIKLSPGFHIERRWKNSTFPFSPALT